MLQLFWEFKSTVIILLRCTEMYTFFVLFNKTTFKHGKSQISFLEVIISPSNNGIDQVFSYGSESAFD